MTASVRPGSRLARRSASDLRAIRHAAAQIRDLDHALEAQLDPSLTPELRMVHLRQATGQITRVANDAVHAYRRVAAALRDEAGRADSDPIEITNARRQLSAARTGMLEALENASRRYPWAAPWASDAG